MCHRVIAKLRRCIAHSQRCWTGNKIKSLLSRRQPRARVRFLFLSFFVFLSFSYLSAVAVRKSPRRRQTVTSSPIQTIVFSSLAEHAARRRSEKVSTGCSKNIYTVYNMLLDKFRFRSLRSLIPKETKLIEYY